jgi:hypothetical protein
MKLMKLVFASVGAAVLAAVIAACGSDSTSISSSSSSSGGRTPRPPSSTSSSGFVDPEDPSGSCPGDAPLSEADLDDEIGWKPSAASPGACSATDLEQLEDNFADTSLTSYSDLGKNLSDTCRACVISKDTDATWGPIVAVGGTSGQTGFVNYGACFGAIEGAPCGKAIQYESFCTNIACEGCATRQELAECVTTSTSANGMCASFANKRTSACPSWALNVKSCGTILKAVATLCGSPTGDAGADGG